MITFRTFERPEGDFVLSRDASDELKRFLNTPELHVEFTPLAASKNPLKDQRISMSRLLFKTAFDIFCQEVLQ